MKLRIIGVPLKRIGLLTLALLSLGILLVLLQLDPAGSYGFTLKPYVVLVLGARLAGVLTAHFATLHLFHGGHSLSMRGCCRAALRF